MKRIDNELMREAILDAVIECKREAVGAEVPLSRIACRAEISERTLNRYFPDKEMLIYEAAVKYLRGRYDAFARQYYGADRSGMNALERLLLLVRVQMENYQSDMVNAMMFVRAFTTALRTAVYKHLPIAGYDAAAREIILSCIADGIRDGSIRGDVEPVDIYLMVSSNVNGLVQRLIYMYSMDYSEAEHKKELFLVFNKYISMLREFLSARGVEPPLSR